MDRITVLKVPRCSVQLYKKQLVVLDVLDRRYCIEQHSDGSVTLPILPCSLSSTDLLHLQSLAPPDGYCQLLHTQTFQQTKKAKPRSAREKLVTALQDLLAGRGLSWNQELEDDLPAGWQRHGDLLLFSEGSFSHRFWRSFGCELWEAVAQALGVKRLAKTAGIAQDGYRTPVVTLLLGESSIVTHVDNHIRYELDITKCMFSFGNITEKLRIASFDCAGETVVDLYAGIGYFTLPYLVHAGAAHVHACEWNPDAISALKRNLQLNNVSDRCTLHPGDNQQLTLCDLADRVNLGLIPSSEGAWPVACRLLRRETGGVLHIHQNITSGPRLRDPVDSDGGSLNSWQRDRRAWHCWGESTAARIQTLLREITGFEWTTSVKHIEHVKSYAPHVHHIVLDLDCRPLTVSSTTKHHSPTEVPLHN